MKRRAILPPGLPLLALTVIVCLLAPSRSRAQADADHPHADTGWTSSGGIPTAADSLPAFRPDSVQDETVRSVESGSTPLASRATAKDSADSVAAMLRGRRPSLSFHGGFNLIDLDALDAFQVSLLARVKRDSLVVLQPFEAVQIAVPVGLQVLWPILPWFDAVARTHSYWYKQTAVLGRQDEPGVVEEYFASQAHLGGAGLRYHVPPALLSVSGKLGLYVQGVYYWLLGGGEFYTNHGSAKAEFDPAGSAWEIQLGFNHVVTRPWTISGGLGYMQQHFLSDAHWSAILVDNPPPGRVEWSPVALQGFLQFNWYFGVGGPPAPTGLPAAGAAGKVPPAQAPAK